MKSIQEYIDKYKGIANDLQLTGDSVDLLVQLLAHATYINEVENINYANESSLERATLPNSKIQHCMDIMYSVFRGSCPRVKLRFRPTKYISLEKYQRVYSSNNFSLYYFGAPKIIRPITTVSVEGENYEEITCIMASNLITDTQTFNEYNKYYIDLMYSNLSSDCMVLVNDEEMPVYRRFTDHIKYGGLFDLTITDYGMRIYAPDIFRSTSELAAYENGAELPPASTTITTKVFEYCSLSDFNETEKSRISIPGLTFPPKSQILPTEDYPGITFIPEVERGSIDSIHYLAQRERFANSIIRSNSDVGYLLEESYPEIVKEGGTVYKFFKLNQCDPEKTALQLYIYYIPKVQGTILTQSQQEEFEKNRASYYVTEDVNIVPGIRRNIVVEMGLELYKNESIDDEVNEILSKYENQFGINLLECSQEIMSAISKISNVRSFIVEKTESGSYQPMFGIAVLEDTGETRAYDPNTDINMGPDDENSPSTPVYYSMSFTIDSKVFIKTPSSNGVAYS